MLSTRSGTTSLDADDQEILRSVFGYTYVGIDVGETGSIPKATDFKRIEALPTGAQQFFSMTFSFDFIPDMFISYACLDSTKLDTFLQASLDIVHIPFLTTVNPSESTIGELLNPYYTIFLGDITTHSLIGHVSA